MKLIEKLALSAEIDVKLTLALTADQRKRSRYQLKDTDDQPIYIYLPRGTILEDGDLLKSDTNEIVRIIAKPEPVLTVTAAHQLSLLRATYHLGNRHVSLEITDTYLRLSPDPVLEQMLIQMDLQVKSEIAPFNPETGAYHHVPH